MRVLGEVLLLVVILACADCRHLQARGWGRQNIPARCVSLSVTPVSCAQPGPHNLVAHPDDCELFYYCVWAGAAPLCRQCPAGLHFNPHLHVCDYPAVAGCLTTVATDATDTTPSPSSLSPSPSLPSNASTVTTSYHPATEDYDYETSSTSTVTTGLPIVVYT